MPGLFVKPDVPLLLVENTNPKKLNYLFWTRIKEAMAEGCTDTHTQTCSVSDSFSESKAREMLDLVVFSNGHI